MSELLPCPFCSNKGVEAKDYSNDAAGSCQVWCHVCGTHGPEEEDLEDAISAWNRRAGKPAVTVTEADVRTALNAYLTHIGAGLMPAMRAALEAALGGGK